MKEYKKRIADELLERKLKGKGAVLIEGPKWCGKQPLQSKYLVVYYIWQHPKIKNKMLH